MGGRVYAADKGDANGEGDEARQFRSSGPGGRSADLTRADGISEEAKRATSGCLGLREEPRGFGLVSGGREEGQVCGRGQESRGSDVCVMTRRVRFGSMHLVSIGERCPFFLLYLSPFEQKLLLRMCFTS